MSRAAAAGQVRAIGGMLAEIDSLAARMEAALGEEQAALAARDAEAIAAAAARKADLAAALESARAALERETGATSGPALAAALRRADPGGTLARRWEALRTRLAALRHRNRANGLAIELQRRAAAQALAVLRGEEAEAPTYGPRGAVRTPSGGGRSLGRG